MPDFAARMAVPDLALLVAGVTLVICLFVYGGTRQLFRDSDTGWHIRTGESILKSRTLPRTDPYSFTRAGQPWFAWEWGADVLFGFAHRLDGLRGVATLTALAISVCSWLWVKLHWAAGGDFFIACLMAPSMLSTAALHWLARPHVLSWVMLLVALLWAERKCRGVEPLRWTDLIAAAAWSALWANLHASFALAPAIALAYAAAKPRFFLPVFAASALGTLANPFGWQLHEHVFKYLTNSELLDRIAEFQSFNFHLAGSWQVMVVVALAAAGATLALFQRNTPHFALCALFFVMAMRSARALPLAALAALPLANGAIRKAAGESWRLRRVFEYSARVRWIDARVNGAVFGAIAIALCLLGLRAPAVAAEIGFPPDVFPVAASEAVAKLPPDARLLAPDMYGGYLIYRFAGERRVYIDGRSDFYGAAYMKQYVDLLEVRPGWREIMRSFQFTHALLPERFSLGDVLEDAGWRVLYRDKLAVLLEAH
jgi:hypothetical protein